MDVPIPWLVQFPDSEVYSLLCICVYCSDNYFNTTTYILQPNSSSSLGKAPHPLYQPLGPAFHLPIPIASHHLICSLAPVAVFHGINEVFETQEPCPPQVEHHVGNDPLSFFRKTAKVGEDCIAVFQSSADVLCEELLHSFISHLGPQWFPMLWVTGQNAMADTYSWVPL